METQDKCDPSSLRQNSMFSAPTALDQGDVWEAEWCHYVMERLFSFSILAARVFALGDPAQHSQGSAGQCM
uniref:Uncharacterized protein n=1 Tax=Gadus morhua TaxID=8049 RepID=A0A8C5C4C5_GADMO